MKLAMENSEQRNHIRELKNIVLQFKELVDSKGVDIQRSLFQRIQQHAPEILWPSTPSSHAQNTGLPTPTSTSTTSSRRIYPVDISSIPPPPLNWQLHDNNTEVDLSFQSGMDFQPGPRLSSGVDASADMDMFIDY